MVKIIDVDALFDKYISDYVYSNIGKVKPEEIENRIPELYVEFGNATLPELDGKTPNDYYTQFNGESLIQCLKEHLDKGVSVSDFLCEAITENPKNELALVNALKEDNDEEFTLYLMNMLSDMSSTLCAQRYLEFILWDYSETIRELATENLAPMAELVKENVLAHYGEVEKDKKACLTDILSNVKNDQRVFEILVNEFIANQDNIPLYANYLVKYGDKKALPYLLTAIENEKINYADFEELRFAIEALGGEYNKVRDFSADKTYKKIKGLKKGSNTKNK